MRREHGHASKWAVNLNALRCCISESRPQCAEAIDGFKVWVRDFVFDFDVKTSCFHTEGEHGNLLTIAAGGSTRRTGRVVVG